MGSGSGLGRPLMSLRGSNSFVIILRKFYSFGKESLPVVHSITAYKWDSFHKGFSE